MRTTPASASPAPTVRSIACAIVLAMTCAIPSIPHPDPWNGVPQCTPAIADAGGVCHGEPGEAVLA